MKKKFIFIFFKKVRYNWYNWRETAIPTLIRSNLYLELRYNWIQLVQLYQKA